MDSLLQGWAAPSTEHTGVTDNQDVTNTNLFVCVSASVFLNFYFSYSYMRPLGVIEAHAPKLTLHMHTWLHHH